jgi:RNase P subunit RPR2
MFTAETRGNAAKSRMKGDKGPNSRTEEELARVNLVRHLKIKHPEGSLLDRKCDHCDRVFTNEIDLRYHIKTKHLEKIKVTCKHCGFSTFPKFNLDLHILKKHDSMKDVSVKNESFGTIKSEPGVY